MKPSSQGTLFNWKGSSRKLTTRHELREQRQAAARDESYDSEILDLTVLPSEKVTVIIDTCKVFSCPKCPQTFDNRLALQNHCLWRHTQTRVKDKCVVPPRRQPCEAYITCSIVITDEGTALSTLRIDGQTCEETKAEAAPAAAAQLERERVRIAESKRRRGIREAA